MFVLFIPFENWVAGDEAAGSSCLSAESRCRP